MINIEKILKVDYMDVLILKAVNRVEIIIEDLVNVVYMVDEQIIV